MESFFQFPDSFLFLLILLAQPPNIVFIGTHECGASCSRSYGIFPNISCYRNLCDDRYWNPLSCWHFPYFFLHNLPSFDVISEASQFRDFTWLKWSSNPQSYIIEWCLYESVWCWYFLDINIHWLSSIVSLLNTFLSSVFISHFIRCFFGYIFCSFSRFCCYLFFGLFPFDLLFCCFFYFRLNLGFLFFKIFLFLSSAIPFLVDFLFSSSFLIRQCFFFSFCQSQVYRGRSARWSSWCSFCCFFLGFFFFSFFFHNPPYRLTSSL